MLSTSPSALPYLPLTLSSLAFTLAMVVMQLVNLLKPFVEAIVPDGSPRHDATIQLLAVALNVAALFGAAALLGQITPQNSIGLLIGGITLGGGSIGAYHLSNSSSTASASVAPAPLAPLALPLVPPLPDPLPLVPPLPDPLPVAAPVAESPASTPAQA